MTALKSTSVDDTAVKLLRAIADFGFDWTMGNPNPSIVLPGQATMQVDPQLLGELVADDLLSVDVRNITLKGPGLHYQLTGKGILQLLESFRALKPEADRDKKWVVSLDDGKTAEQWVTEQRYKIFNGA